jgi:acyl-CoA synthetase (AMP-forming)/AMP-acid ligase II
MSLQQHLLPLLVLMTLSGPRDVGSVHKNGFVYVIDCTEYIFKCRGHHINPSEIENVIELIGGVGTVAIVSVSNPR